MEDCCYPQVPISKTDDRARKAITHTIESSAQRRWSWQTYHTPGHNLQGVGLRNIPLLALLVKVQQKQLSGGGGKA